MLLARCDRSFIKLTTKLAATKVMSKSGNVVIDHVATTGTKPSTYQITTLISQILFINLIIHSRGGFQEDRDGKRVASTHVFKIDL